MLNLIHAAGIEPWFTIEGGRVVAFRRRSMLGGSLVFLFNLEQRTAHTRITLRWPVESVRDLLRQR